MADRTLVNVSASGDGDKVKLYGFAEWLKGQPMVWSDMPPTLARKVAVALLIAADRVEEIR